ncbi:MAG: hypothetical protein QOF16_1675 [Actinomycetota bacterium]|nr:hypothetical protein [Actinomycetota bacterium]MEA2488021.1 hypothetical protein [Actinomycetota bacterium]
MRKLSEPEAHRARTAIINGDYPEGMQARCGWCREVRSVDEGSFVDAARPGVGAARVFRCGECERDEESNAA